MTTRTTIIATYLRHEERLGGPDMVKDALAAAAEELGLPYITVYEAVITSPLMAGNVGRG